MLIDPDTVRIGLIAQFVLGFGCGFCFHAAARNWLDHRRAKRREKLDRAEDEARDWYDNKGW